MPEPITTPTPHDGIPDSTVNPTYAYNGTTDRLSKVEGQVAALNVGLTEVNRSIDGLRVDVKSLDAKIDGVEKGLNAKIDGVERGLNAKIDGVEKGLNAKIDGLEKSLNAKFDAKIDGVEKSLNAKIDGVEKSLSTLEKSLSTVKNIAISILVTFGASLAVALIVLFSQR